MRRLPLFSLLLSLLVIGACKSDGDGDGFSGKNDCDDDNGDVHPGATEICNGYDDDCDEWIDDLDPEVADVPTWYLDEDADTWGESSTAIAICDPGAGWSQDSTDCDDHDAAVHPEATEICNGLDDDCNGWLDEQDPYIADVPVWYLDRDADTFGAAAYPLEACAAPEGYVADATDCDDAQASVRPGATETCDGLDNDCDSQVDDSAIDAPMWYADTDGDGFGGTSVASACDAPAGYAPSSGDCDDDDPTTFPGATEVCHDGVLNDCQSTIPDVQFDCLQDTLVNVGILYQGESTWSKAGWSLAFAGDTNGDGTDELLVGAPFNSDAGSHFGKAYIVSAPLVGGSLTQAMARIEGRQAESFSGWSVSGAGDVDQDAYADLLVGAPGEDSSRGAAYLLQGPVQGDLTLASAAARLTGDTDGDNVGMQVSGAGDLNADGHADFLVSAPGADTDLVDTAGAVYLVLGPVSGNLSLAGAAAWNVFGEDSYYQTGAAMAAAGDTNGDGFDDILVGAPGYVADVGVPGAAFLFQGPLYGSQGLTDADASFLGENDADRAGASLAGAGDVDGDGYEDLLVGAYDWGSGAGTWGATYIVRGPVQGEQRLSWADSRIIGEAEGGAAGFQLAGAGDVDADGFDDILITAPTLDTLANDGGAAYIVRGPIQGITDVTNADGRLLGQGANDLAGQAAAGGGDIDGDGYDDMAIGAPDNEDGGAMAGLVYVVLGASW